MSAWRVIVREPGGPEMIGREDFAALPEPKAGEVRVRNTAIGVNFLDVYHRIGLYPRTYPSGLGSEAVGVIEAVGPDVDDVKVGGRVGYLFAADGTYATHSITRANGLFHLPDGISDDVGAASLLKGLTAWMLIEKCARVEAGQTILVLAAAGGVGSIAVQWLKAIGATVIAHAGSAEKGAIARTLGADHILHCGFTDLAAEVRKLTDGKGVAAVLDGVGKDSAVASLDSLAQRGMFVSYGNSSGPVAPLAPLELARRGSLLMTRPTLGDFTIDPAERDEGTSRLFGFIESGAIKIDIGQRFPLEKAADAHRALEARQTTGSTILLP